MSFDLFLAYDKLEIMSVDDLEIKLEKLMHPVNIVQCLIDIKKNPEYNLLLRFRNDGWHFNFCKYFDEQNDDRIDRSMKCNCMDFILSGTDRLFDILKNVFDGFDIFVLCRHFEFLDISKQDLKKQIDSIKDLLVDCKNDKNFMKLYTSLLKPGFLSSKEFIQVSTTIVSTTMLPILEKLKVKKFLFNSLLQKWIKSISFFIVNEQIHLFPHLLNMYKKYPDKYCSKFLKIKDLVEVLDKLINEQQQQQQIELEINSLYDDKGQILNAEDFTKSLRKFKGSSKNIILNEIVESFQQIKDPVCYIVSLRIGDENDSRYRIPIYKYQRYDDLIGDFSKIVECRNRAKEIDESLHFINERIGYHFSFCPNTFDNFLPYRYCNCLKEICDDDKKMLDVLKIYAKQFRISILNKHFEYFNFTFHSQIKVLDEIFHDKEFNDLHENLDRGRCPKYNVRLTIMPLLEKLKVRRDTFIELLKGWENRCYSLCEIFGIGKNEIKHLHCWNIYKSLIDESTKNTYNEYLIRDLRRLDIESKIYLEKCNSKGLVQKFEGDKNQVIRDILKKGSKDDLCEIKSLVIDDDDEALYYTIPISSFLFYEDLEYNY